MRHTALLLLPLALAACGKPDPDVPGNGTFAMDVPGFKASVQVPSFGDINAAMDINGLTLHEGTKIGGINVQAGEDEKGSVTMQFADPTAGPAALMDYYLKQAAEHGFAVTVKSPDGLTLTKGDDTVRFTFAPKGAGSTGTMVVMDGSK
ncbi:hypothetical protein [Sphingomonas sp. ID0503]|uniref:hypothetical protein n=1 Tax=Sphingomonas sp. ID0503 TaxID=3399691 RepID=UPI003AFA1E04